MDRYCRNCHIKLDHKTGHDQAQNHGFCSDLCRKLYAEERNYMIRREEGLRCEWN